MSIQERKKGVPVIKVKKTEKKMGEKGERDRG
jgi:hypothetical protein